MPGSGSFAGNSAVQGNPYMQGINRHMQQGNPYMQGNTQPFGQNNTFMQNTNQTLANDQYRQNDASANANPYLQGNPYAGLGINKPSDASVQKVPNITETSPDDLFKPVDAEPAPTDTPVAGSGFAQTTPGGETVSPAVASVQEYVNSPAPQTIAPAAMGPQADERPAPEAMGALKSQMPNTAPNPFLQNLENLNKDSGTDNT